ncbi:MULTISPECIES: ATP-binding protein [Natrinema]|uniref:histidine kinase n=1 Tax=Natrinema gari JCM 14663 TaxID=1230459 RepID=L9YWW6_9EURY|nr:MULTISPECIES: ATP-binding protein [Natrinema]AFO55440.1 ATP-binding region ATPase domain protein [Natrinema sp. J7-2]ELY78710.1 ATP-binding region ATPase domain protein [Natrinema gari JCM 14663]
MSHDTPAQPRTESTRPWLNQEYIPRLIGWFGGLSVLAFAGWTVAFAGLIDVPGLLLNAAFTGGPAVGLIWGGYRLDRSDIETGRYARILQWCVGGSVGFLAINLMTMVFFPWYNLAGNISWAHFSVNAGAVGGFAVGYVEARAIQREVEATVATVRADQLADERELLMYLNDLLRHEVLNSAQIISGHASLLQAACDDERVRTRLQTIERESDELVDVIDDIRAMLEANRGPETHSSVDLTALLTTQVAECRARFDEAVIDVELPESAHVRGNEGLKWLFSNLLENAIEHDDAATTHVRVTVDKQPETVTVTVTDDGPGIPDKERETLFERKSTNHGLGLYLSRILANRYGGTVDLADTGPDGSVFVVTLPRISAADDAEASDSRRH